MADIKNGKFRNFEIILYPDNSLHVDILYTIKKDFEYAYILHDKDLKEDLIEYKKKHWHVQIFCKTQHSLSAIQKKLNLDNVNLIQVIKDKKKAIRYLIHADNNEKEQYDVDSIITNIDIAPLFQNLVSDETCDIQLILDYLDSQTWFVSYRSFVSFIRESNIWSTYRRNQFIINKLIDEHNADVKGEALKIFQ